MEGKWSDFVSYVHVYNKLFNHCEGKKNRRLVHRCIPWLHLGNNLYLLKKEKCCWRCRGEKSENEYNDCLHRLYIKDYICAIDKKMRDMTKDCFVNSIKIKL